MLFSTQSLGLAALAKMVSAQQAPSTSSTAATAAAAALKAKAAVLNEDFQHYILIVLASLIVFFGLWRVGIESVKKIRTLACLNSDTQGYFAVSSTRWASFKKHLLYAPIFSKRHNKEIQLSSAINVGTLPTRFQLLFLLSYFGTNVIFCVYSVHWDLPVAAAAKELRNRTGILAVVNMVCYFPPSSLWPKPRPS